MYQLRFSKQALKTMEKLDRYDSKLIYQWLLKHIEETDNPRARGKALVGNKKGLWRYRVGNYRILCEIQEAQLVVLALKVGRRRDI
ncbi:MAG: type II toxin-antitoxin system RelE/ParE family toxin [Aerococcus sp.]|nr:type II toxin-antitoxin system RelE/ParE family toxin [Aerococcus sp.]